MRLFIIAGVFAMALGGYFHEDIEYYFENEFGGMQGNSSGSSSVGNLGNAVNNNFGRVGGSLGH